MLRTLALLFFGVVATSLVLQVALHAAVALPPQRIAIFAAVSVVQAAVLTLIVRRRRS